MAKKYQTIIVGAGAAGLMAAITAGRRGRSVLLIDHSANPGAKILISGGGRCNFTNLKVGPENFLSNNPNFCRTALKAYSSIDFIKRVEQFGISYHEKTLGQLFCDQSSRQILQMLLSQAGEAGVEIRCGQSISEVTRDQVFQIKLGGQIIHGENLVLATGGLSIPKMGATGWSLETAKNFGLEVVPPRPALVPLTFGPDLLEWSKNLSGLSAPAIVSYGKIRFRENILFTHRGLSGPAILQISSYLPKGAAMEIDFAPDLDLLALWQQRKRERGKIGWRHLLSEFLPQRLAQTFVDRQGLTGNLADAPDRHLAEIAKNIKSWKVVPIGNEGYAKAEVMAGGVDTNGLDPKTMMAKNHPGLFVIGEAVDVTGWLGGYNFQWAWSSGYCCGSAV